VDNCIDWQTYRHNDQNISLPFWGKVNIFHFFLNKRVNHVSKSKIGWQHTKVSQ